MHRESFLICLILFGGCQSIGYRGNHSRCKETDLVLYNLVFETQWTRELFPKQYPENRPPAHWSKMIGITHDENYVLFRIGEVADKNFKKFAETGKTEALSGQKNLRQVLDEFSSSSIKTGAGKVQINFFVDGNHSMVSLAVKIIPSPDWFVGVDSLMLCVEGNWLDSVTIEASPMDAGTNSGFTFTAPKWESKPQERISKITSKWPWHPSSSFYYPKLKDLPVIATFHIIKSAESSGNRNEKTDFPNEKYYTQSCTPEKKFYQLKKKVEIKERQSENTTKIPSKSIYYLDNSFLIGRRSKYRKYKRRKFKKYNAKMIEKSDEK